MSPDERRELPTVVVFNAITDRVQAHPGLLPARAPVQGGFHVRAAQVRSFALAHDQHLGHVGGHAPVEAAGRPLAPVGAAALAGAGLEDGRQVAVAHRVADAVPRPVRARSGAAAR